MSRKNFPKDFLWGTATSAYQVEGNNFNNDWSKWENSNSNTEKAGTACNQYELYEQDFKLAKDFLHNNTHRISIEWSRIFPQNGVIDREEIEHYKKVLRSLKKNNLKIILTLHHFTNPIWFTEIGDWKKKENIKYFMDYVQVAIDEFGEFVDYWLIFNEPNVYTFLAFSLGIRSSEKYNLVTAIKIYLNLAKTHKLAYEVIHKKFTGAKVTSCLNFTIYESSFWLKPIKPIVSWVNNRSFPYLTKGYNDFIGIDYYFSYWLGKSKEKLILSDFGWVIYPKGIYEVCKDVYARYKLPIIIIENGIADSDDDQRPQYITDHLTWLHQAISEGVDVRGYLHWSLIDNFEWQMGYKMKFGLFEVDFDTQKRTPRKSAYLYAKICEENSL